MENDGKTASGTTSAGGDFFTEFKDSLTKAVQNDERGQILDLLSQARRIRIDPAMAGQVFMTIRERPDLIERNLDVIDLADPVTWIEIDRTQEPDADGVVKPAKIGFLISRHPADESILIAAIARRTPEKVGGECHLMPAFCAVSTESLADLAQRARASLLQKVMSVSVGDIVDRARGRTNALPKETAARLILHMRTYVPPGIMEEIVEMANAAEYADAVAIHKLVREEATAEGVYLLGMLVAISAGNVAFTRTEDGVSETSVHPLRRGWLTRKLAALRGHAGAGIVRTDRGGRSVIKLVDA